MPPINLAWCRDNLKWIGGSFADMEKVANERAELIRKQREQYREQLEAKEVA